MYAHVYVVSIAIASFGREFELQLVSIASDIYCARRLGSTVTTDLEFESDVDRVEKMFSLKRVDGHACMCTCVQPLMQNAV